MHQIPSSLPPLFSGDRLVVYGLLKPSESASQDGKMEVRLQGTLGKDEKMEHLISFPTPPHTSVFDAGVDCNLSVFVHCLAAKSFIQVQQDELSDKYGQELEEAKSPIVSVSESANVVSKFTSFVAVDKENHQPVSGPLRKHVVPSYDVLMAGHSYNACDKKSKKGGMKLGFGFMKKLKSVPFKKMTKSPKEEEELNNVSVKAAPLYLCGSDDDEDCEDDFDLEVEGDCASFPLVSCQTPFASCAAASQQTKEASSVLSLISLQKASGAWDLTDQLVLLCGKTRDALITGYPTDVAVDTAEGKLLWATALALVLLMGKFLDQKDEWEMIAEKGKKWIKKNLPGAVKYDNMLESAATAVGVQL